MSDQSPRRYTSEEVNAILQRALERQGGGASITHNELVETARELGIDPRQLDAAIDDFAANAGLETAREQWKKVRRQKFFNHLWSYIIVNAFFLIMALVVGEPAVFFAPLLGWGVGLAFHARSAFFPSDDSVEHGARRMLERRKREEWRMMRRIGKKDFRVDGRHGKIVIEKGDKRIEIG
jgi:hypothetical protein